MQVFKAFVYSVIFTVAFVFCSSQAQAQSSVAGTVNYVGQVVLTSSSYAVVIMTPTGATTRRSLILPTAQAKEMMAIALTAMSSNYKIACDLGPSGQLISMYIVNS